MKQFELCLFFTHEGDLYILRPGTGTTISITHALGSRDITFENTVDGTDVNVSFTAQTSLAIGIIII